MLSYACRDGLNLDGVEVLGGFVGLEFDELLHVHVVADDGRMRKVITCVRGGVVEGVTGCVRGCEFNKLLHVHVIADDVVGQVW